MQLDMLESIAARDAAIEQVKSGREQWMKSALNHAHAFLAAKRGQLVRLEQVREVISPFIADPGHVNTWGALAQSITKAGWWEPAGYEPSESVAAKRRVTRVYRVVM